MALTPEIGSDSQCGEMKQVQYNTFRAGMLLPQTASKKTMGKSLNHRNRLTYLANFFPLIRNPSASVVKPAPGGEYHLFSQD